ncbi:MAG: hypothetical protein KDA41_19145, partial [Planctomycetales bacterium]|nr:hypothetical protein [Planctomycetales bacterium]
MHALLLAATVVAAAGSMGAAHGEKQEAQRAVQREFRYYRITVYNTFRTRRSEYDARRAAGDAAFQAWLAAGRPIGQAEALSQWFRHAKAVSSAAQLAALPPLPVFVAEVAPRPAPQHDITPQLTTSPAPPAIDKPMQLRAEDDLVVS